MEIKKFKPGDKVTVTQRGGIEWEGAEDFTARNWADLKDDTIYTIGSYNTDDNITVIICEDMERGFGGYRIHPNHFTLVESALVQDNYKSYLEERIEALEESHKDYKEKEIQSEAGSIEEMAANSIAAGIWDTICELRNALEMYTQNLQP